MKSINLYCKYICMASFFCQNTLGLISYVTGVWGVAVLGLRCMLEPACRSVAYRTWCSVSTVNMLITYCDTIGMHIIVGRIVCGSHNVCAMLHPTLNILLLYCVVSLQKLSYVTGKYRILLVTCVKGHMLFALCLCFETNFSPEMGLETEILTYILSTRPTIR